MDVDAKDLFCFRVAPLKADNYYVWSHDMEVVHRGEGLWKFVSEGEAKQPEVSEFDAALSPCSSELEGEVQKRHLALLVILTDVDSTCKALVLRLRCHKKHG